MFYRSQVPIEIGWRAVQTAGLHGLCLACCRRQDNDDCLMYAVPWTLDCGAGDD